MIGNEQFLLRQVLLNACDRHGITGFSANGVEIETHLAVNQDGGLPALAMIMREVWQQLGLVTPELYEIDDDDPDDGFPMEMERDASALLGQRVEYQENPNIPFPMLLMVADYSVERMAITARLQQSIEPHQPVQVDLAEMVDLVLPQPTPEAPRYGSLGI